MKNTVVLALTLAVSKNGKRKQRSNVKINFNIFELEKL